VVQSDSHRPSTAWEHRLHRSIGQLPEDRYLRRGLRFFSPFSLYGVDQHGLRVKSMKPASVLKSCRNAHRNSPPLGAMDTVNVNRPSVQFCTDALSSTGASLPDQPPFQGHSAPKHAGATGVHHARFATLPRYRWRVSVGGLRMPALLAQTPSLYGRLMALARPSG
jgi:hypothetical protein